MLFNRCGDRLWLRSVLRLCCMVQRSLITSPPIVQVFIVSNLFPSSYPPPSLPFTSPVQTLNYRRRVKITTSARTMKWSGSWLFGYKREDLYPWEQTVSLEVSDEPQVSICFILSFSFLFFSFLFPLSCCSLFFLLLSIVLKREYTHLFLSCSIPLLTSLSGTRKRRVLDDRCFYNVLNIFES